MAEYFPHLKKILNVRVKLSQINENKLLPWTHSHEISEYKEKESYKSLRRILKSTYKGMTITLTAVSSSAKMNDRR